MRFVSLNKVNLSLTFTQRLGHQAHNCKMAYCQRASGFPVDTLVLVISLYNSKFVNIRDITETVF